MADKDPLPGISPDPIRFEEAIAAIRRRVPMTEDVWDLLEEEERDFAFTVANVTQLDMVVDVYEACERAVAEGRTLEDFKADVGDVLERAWGEEDPARLEAVFRTNTMGAYNSGRHEAAQAVKRDRPYWRFDGPRDDRTSKDICLPCVGVILPADHHWWRTHYPILHWNALASGTLITTASGPKQIERVTPGTLVLTHRGRWRPVDVVMGKRCDTPTLLRVKLSSGRELLITKEHPVLTAQGWKAAGNLQIGDEAFEHCQPVRGVRQMPVAHPENFPSLFDQEEVAFRIARAVRGELVALPVDLKGHQARRESKVDHQWADRELGDGLISQQPAHRLFGRPQALPVGGRDRRRATLLRRLLAYGIVLRHALRVAGEQGARLFPHSEGPVLRALATSYQLVADLDLLGLGSNGDPAAPAEGPECTVGEAMLAFDRPDGSARVPVLSADEGGDVFGGSEVSWMHSAVVSIADVPLKKSVWNLSVAEDHSYVADGVIVHNCRHRVSTLTKEQAEEQGITSSPPDVEVPDGFGKPPSTGGGSDWEPDTEDLPGDLAAALEDREAG